MSYLESAAKHDLQLNILCLHRRPLLLCDVMPPPVKGKLSFLATGVKVVHAVCCRQCLHSEDAGPCCQCYNSAAALLSRMYRHGLSHKRLIHAAVGETAVPLRIAIAEMPLPACPQEIWQQTGNMYKVCKSHRGMNIRIAVAMAVVGLPHIPCHHCSHVGIHTSGPASRRL